MTPPILATLAIALGGVGVFLAMPRGRSTTGKAALVLLAAAAALLILAILDRAAPGETTGWFAALAVIALTAAVRVITHPRPVYSALYFILVILAVTGLLVMMQAEFLAASLLIIYAGAILVTYVFVIMLAQQSGEAPYDRDAREPFLATIAGFVLLGVLAAQIFGPAVAGRPTGSQSAANSINSTEAAGASAALETADASAATESADASVLPASAAATPDNVVLIGTHLLTRYAVGVELAGVLLLASMVGAIAIARRRPEEFAEEEA